MMPLKLEGKEQGEATKGSLSTPRMRHATMPCQKALCRQELSKCLDDASDYAWLKGPQQIVKQNILTMHAHTACT
eukprot:3610553-Rhodomonas_salina.1